ncbi:MAG: YidC/Oxa1 family rane protein insertase [Solirubrobacteraceae bacterium]|jgi:YidC/Oxa1 family membrane protein insertase|nr:YidC/Oxa1 family rane protein insertase [Solirubrobacteraceae bacterium]
MPTISANIIQDAFGPLIKVFETILVFIHAHITGGSWGLAIIGLTIVVRAALVPLTLKQFSSMAKLQALGPELKELQKKYKDDKPRLNEEMMKFYKQNEVNPFGSCLPLVLQLPVFLSLFYMLRLDLKPHICGSALKAHHIVSQAAIAKQSCGAIDPNSGKFLFIPDVTATTHGGVLVILIVLYIGSQLVASLLTTATVDRNQRLLMLGLPFVFSIFIAGFPAGLLVYWITTNIWTVGQQYIVKKRSGPVLALAAEARAAAASSGGGGRGGGSTTGKGVNLPSDKPPPQGLMARLSATRDAARSAVTGASQAAPAKNGPTTPKGGGARPTPAKQKSVPAPRSAGQSKARAATPAESRGSRATKAQPAKGSSAKAPSKGSGSGAANRAEAKKPASGGDGAGPAGARDGGAPAGARAAGGKTTPGGARPSRGAAKPAAGAEGDGASAKAEPAEPRARGAAPPPPPRKKKKRSGRRR